MPPLSLPLPSRAAPPGGGGPLAARVVSFWGKGGSGKSTLAAAAALAYSGLGLRVLAVSTDPSPALGLLLCGAPAGPGGRRCGSVGVVEAGEEDVRRLWVERFGDEVYEVVSAFLPVDRWIVDYVAGAPGVADQYMLYLVYTLAAEAGYDVVVWDTAAAGGSLRLLRLEHELYRHLGDAARLYLRLRGSLERLRRGEAAKTPLELIEEWRRLAGEILGWLRGPRHRLVVVAQPDRLGLHVSRSLVEEFRLHGIEPWRLVANMVVDASMCPACRPWLEDARMQEEALRGLGGLGVPLCRVPRLPSRPSSREGLEPLRDAILDCLGAP